MQTICAKSFLTIIACLLLLGCSGCLIIRMTAPMHILPDGRCFPKKPQFTVIPNENSSDSGLDFSSLYVSERIWLYEGKTHTNYYHLRFWPTGECIAKGGIERYLDRYDVDGFSLWGEGWSMGFYNVVGSNIVFEIYVPDSYNKDYGVVISNEIHVTRVDLKYAAAKFTYSSPVDDHYVRYPMGQLTA